MTTRDITALLDQFRDPVTRDSDGTMRSGMGIDVQQAQRLVRDGHAEWFTEPWPSERRWEWRLRDAAAFQRETGHHSPDVV